MIVESGLMKSELLAPLLVEANELVAIMTSSRISAARNKAMTETVTKSQRGIGKQQNQKSEIKNLK
jgi:hypothetical protein